MASSALLGSKGYLNVRCTEVFTPNQQGFEAKPALKLQKLSPTHCEYVGFNLQNFTVGEFRAQMGQLKRVNVCGIGALLIAHVARFNEFELKHQDIIFGKEISLDRDRIVKHLRDVFPGRMLNDIENVYEGKVCDDLMQRIRRNHIGSRALLIAIMQDIVDHEGTFDPERLAC